MTKISLFVTGVFLKLFLFSGLVMLGLVMLISNGDHIKKALVSADAYNRIVPAVIEASSQQTKNQGDLIPLKDQEVQKIIAASFDSTTLSVSSEKFIDSVYSWLEGDKSTIDYSIDFTKNKLALAEGLSTYAVNRVDALPPCQSVPASVDLYELTCRPPNVDLNQQRLALRDEILKNENFLPQNQTEKAITGPYKAAPEYFSGLKKTPWIFLILALALAAVTIGLSSTRREGIKKVGITLLGTGVGLFVLSLFSNLGLDRLLSQSQTAKNSNNFTSLIGDIGGHLFYDFSRILISIAIPVIILGGVILLTLRFIGSRKQ